MKNRSEMSSKPTITLCMIVKDEKHVIERCLRSIAPYIDRYDITDTGSTDGTQDIIKNVMAEYDIPGEVYQSDWKGFGDHAGNIGSRTEAFRNAESGGADFAWVIDADDTVEGDFKFPDEMDADGYAIRIRRESFSWWRNHIFKLEHGWRYVGILHEYAEATKKQDCVIGKIEGDYSITARTEGNRNIGITAKEKYSRDAEILEKALEDDPENHRYQFYLAQSYFDSQQWEKAKKAYKKRVEQGGWNEEAYYAQYRVGLLSAVLKEPEDVVQMEFIKAHNIRPIRAEPLVELSRLNRLNGRPAAAYIFAKRAVEMEFPVNDILFISEDVYRFVSLDELGATAFFAGKPHEGYAACKKLLEENLIPKEHESRVKTNLEEYMKVLSQIGDDEVKKINLQLRSMNNKQKVETLKQKVNNKTFKKRKAKG